jgi:transcriptional regulator with XRE-family HTH domain
MDEPDELGASVRAWRERLRPEAVGLPKRSGTRTPGLRREDLAALAGVSVDYVVRLEQGRATNPSTQVVAALARALALGPDERDHLFRLARQAVPDLRLLPTTITPGVKRIVDRLGDAAVSVHDPAWTMLAWNATWAALMGDPSALRGRERNLIWRHFAGVGGRIERDDIDDFEHDVIADLRAATGRYPEDPQLRRLIADLRRESARFAELWAGHEVAVRRADRKTVRHPDVGAITVDCDMLRTVDTGLTVIVYTAARGSADAEKLDLVRVIGLQQMVA